MLSKHRKKQQEAAAAEGAATPETTAEAVVPEGDPADPARGGGDQQLAERRRRHHRPDRLAFAAAAIRAGGHPQVAAGLLVDRAARSVSRFVGRGRHQVAGLQRRPQASGAALVGVGAGREAEGLPEHALQMERAEAERGLRTLGAAHS